MHAENPLRKLPQVQRLLEAPGAEALCADYGRGAVTAAIRQVLAQLREDMASGLAVVPEFSAVLERCGFLLAARRRPPARRAPAGSPPRRC